MITILEKPVSFGGGISLPANKAISLQQALQKAELPSIITLPLRQHIGLPAKPIVAVGDSVMKGQTIARAQGSISVPTHASTSGIVREIAEHSLPNPSGTKEMCIVIESDGEDTWLNERHFIEDYYSLEPVALQQRVLEAGIVGLGGAGFPSAMKLIPGLSLDIELLILNAAECEPYISCDETLIRNNARDVITGVEILAHALQVDECVIAIEDNKTAAIEILKQALVHAGIEIRLISVSSLYPAGGEKQLIKSVTGIEVPANGLPVDIGVVCYNVGTAVAIKKAVLDDEPLINRIVTISGSGVNQPCNLEVLIGTPLHEIIEQCGGYNDSFEYLIMGGPMMGFRLHSDHVPLIKTTNCLLATRSAAGVSGNAESPCIRCDDCAPVCPVNLQPQQLHWHSKEFNTERLQDYRLFDCIECGCCAYVCPSHISLVDHYRLAKSKIWNNRRKRLEEKQNKQRYVAKQFRLEQQTKSINGGKKAAVKTDPDSALQKKQAEIAAAVQRVEEKKRRGKGH